MLNLETALKISALKSENAPDNHTWALGGFAWVFTPPPEGLGKVLGGGGAVLPIIQTPESIFELFLSIFHIKLSV